MPPADLDSLTPDELRPLLAEAMLPHVPFDGWSRKAAAAAAADLGLAPAIATAAFPDGRAGMVSSWFALADRRMLQALATDGFRAMKVRERIRTAIRTHIEETAPHREALRRALSLLALPGNAATTARLAWRTADSIWRAAGDTSADFNHYSKRAIAAAIYLSTRQVWLDDDSDGCADTWAFLDRRIEGVMRFERLKARLRHRSGERPGLARFLGRLRYPAT